jgi:polysaccharide biosynthesis/export protein
MNQLKVSSQKQPRRFALRALNGWISMNDLAGPLRFAAFATLIVLFASQVRAQKSRQVADGNPVNSKLSDPYRIGGGDVLEIRVFNRPQLSRESVRVDNGGLIRMPMIEGEIDAGCRSETELAELIATFYKKYLHHPHVDVFVKEYSSKPVAVIGAVDKPGQFQLQRRVRLLELVSLAGGPTDRAGERVLVAGNAGVLSCDKIGDSTNSFQAYNLNNTLKGEDVSNPYVRPGDIITIPEAQQVFVVGNVFKPISISLKEKLTVSQAVAMAGGTMADAQKSRVHVLRQLPGDKSKTDIVVNLDAIRKREADDIELRANDIVEVPTSGGKRFLRGLLTAVAPGFTNSVRMIP